MSSSEKKETKLKLKKEIRRFRQEIESRGLARERNSQTTSPSCIRNCYTLHFIILG